jgi:5'-nucleotidase
LTSNFLQEGGDKMVFFANPIELYSLDLNLREVLIKYIQSKKEIIGKLDNRIIRLK